MTKDDDMLTKEELLSIQRGLDDLKAGRVSRMEKWESLDDFLEREEKNASDSGQRWR